MYNTLLAVLCYNKLVDLNFSVNICGHIHIHGVLNTNHIFLFHCRFIWRPCTLVHMCCSSQTRMTELLVPQSPLELLFIDIMMGGVWSPLLGMSPYYLLSALQQPGVGNSKSLYINTEPSHLF